MFRINMQFDEEISENELSLSEVQVNNIMNTKIGPENTYFNFGENGESTVTVPQGSMNPSLCRELFSKSVKILEACLYGENINVYNLFAHCVAYGRMIFDTEVKKQRASIEQGMTGTIPLSVFITSKSNTNLSSTKKVVSPMRKQFQLPECN